MMKTSIVLAGLEKDVLLLANELKEQYDIMGYTDVVDRKTSIKYLGRDEDFIKRNEVRCGILIPIDSPKIRRKLVSLYRQANFFFPNLISTDAKLNNLDISNSEGLIIQSSVYISADVKIGNFVKLNVGSKVFHDSTIGEYSTLAPGATVLGSCAIGTDCYLGSNCTIKNGVSVGDKITVGFASVVTKSLLSGEGFVYAGNPATQLIRS